MSWMDSWSRPSKHAATPPPMYLLPGGETTPYCHSCGRVIGSRKAQTSKRSKEGVKYCSERCRHRKTNQIDRNIENTFVSLLNGAEPAARLPDGASSGLSSRKKDTSLALWKRTKGEPRITVLCSTVEELIFGSRNDPDKVFGRRKNRAKRGVPDIGEWKSVDMEDSTSSVFEDYSKSQPEGEMHHHNIRPEDQAKDPFTYGAGKTRPAQSVSDVNFSVGGERGWAEKIEETEELKQKRLEGQRKAEEREAVRCAARRLCAFGIVISEVDEPKDKGNGGATRKQKEAALEDPARTISEHVETRRKCEAVLNEGTIVEASFAKGEWGIRWRE
ncbi:hypothetical protein EPUS_05781 [Endocarpon pusillum Z07020]|uniref:Uncharacterized protein n=1 Tax=Endocarpon pusillum (strain Z07020 / HMAS-L-300199) TaxID=1263415 RepID=U1GHQ5_ENDPU|nr:uncharacterized protein EPUS_05781 [Endocarpon pusillum Z07020]ERF77212.1 hypothetical protein EPUS_05781 [Endocarpon pusillum Z07020]